MANHHLRNRELSLKAKGLLSLMLSLPEDWDYTTKGLSCICKDGVDSICATIKELEKAGYVKRRRLRDAQGRLSDLEYTILEKPEPLPSPPESPQRENPVVVKPDVVEPDVDNPELGKPHTENPAQLSIQEVNKQESIKHTPAEIEDLQETKTYIDHVACVCLAKAQIPTCSRHKYFHRCPPRWIYYARLQRQILIFDHQVLRTW